MADLATLTPQERRLLAALAGMAAQYLEGETGQLDHQCMGAGERAFELLREFGLVTPNGRVGFWTPAGEQFLRET